MLDLLAARGKCRVGFQALDEFLREHVETLAQRVLRVFADLVQDARGQAHGDIGAFAADQVRRQHALDEGVLVAQPIDDALRNIRLRLFVVQQCRQLVDAFVQQFLVASSPRQAFQDGAGRFRQVDAFHHRMHRLAQEILHRRVIEKVEHPGSELDQVLPHAPGIGRFHQPVGDLLRRVMLADQADDGFGIEEFFAHEEREVLGDLDLVLRDDLGMARDDGNRNALEQRHHGEPVRPGADHGGPRKGFQQAGPPVLRQEKAEHKQRGRAEEKRQR